MKRSALALLSLAPLGFADLSSSVESLGSDAAKGYTSTITSPIGTTLNHGLFNHAPNPDLWGIDLQVGLNFVGASFSSAKNYSANTTLTIDPQTAKQAAAALAASRGITDATVIDNIAGQLVGKSVNVTINGPTATGSTSDKTLLTIQSTDKVTTPAGDIPLNAAPVDLGVEALDVPGFLPGIGLPYPQLTVGTLAGTQVGLRGLPIGIPAGGYGHVKFWGFGINHNPGFWHDKENFLPLGINSSVNFTYTSLSLGESFEWSGWSAGVMASRKLGLRMLNVTPFVAAGLEGSTLKLAFQTTRGSAGGQPIHISMEQDGDAKAYLQGGLGVRLGIFNFDASGTLSSNPGLALGGYLAF